MMALCKVVACIPSSGLAATFSPWEKDSLCRLIAWPFSHGEKVARSAG